jgi:hypothetical protein
MSSEDRDLELTVLTRRMFKSMGFYAELKVPLFVPTYAKVFKRSPSSDADVLGIRFDIDFQPSVAIAEAKSGEEKALDQLLKLSAVAGYLKTAKKFLIKSQIHENAREVGRQLGVVCLSESELAQILKNLTMDTNPPSSEELVYYRQQKAWLLSMRKQDSSRRLANYLESEVWSRPYWENLNNVVYMLKNFLKGNDNNPPVYIDFVIFRAIQALTIAILYFCRQIMTSSVSDVGRGVELFILGGPGARRQRERLRDEIQRIAPSLKGLNIPIESPFLSDLKEVVAYFILSPRAAVLTLQVFDDALEVVTANGGKFEAVKWPSGHSSVSMKLAKDVLQFALKSCGYVGQSKSFSEFLAL